MRYVLALITSLLALPAVADGLRINEGMLLGQTCAGCHGTGGISQGPATPSLAGIDSEYFIDAMREFREGRRAATIMDRIAKGYTPEQVQAMAGYFAAQPYRPPARRFDAALAKEGQRLHERFCEKCHSDNGRDADDSAVLAGQPERYLRWTLDDYVSGRRQAPRKMRRRLEQVDVRLGKEGFAALAHFYASQRLARDNESGAR